MANQSEEELIAEAKKIKEEADKKAKALLQKAKEIKKKKLIKLGEQARELPNC